MLPEVIGMLRPRDGGVYLDGTFGGGGYARGILAAAHCTLWAIDRDPQAIERGAAIMHEVALHDGDRAARLHLIEGSFGSMMALLAECRVHQLDGVVLDLGVSSFQLDDPGRGFSFRADGPLDMRMSRHGETAADLIRTLPEADLADTLYALGEERLSRRVARAIVTARAEAPIETTLQLAAIIRAVVPPDRSGRLDPATRSFQALRLRVNDELGEIQRGLAQAAELLAPGGRLVVVAFHSLEDRIVKRFMIEAAGRLPLPSRHDPRGLGGHLAPPRYRLLANRAARPGEQEEGRNPRARSARLRGLERLDSASTIPSAPPTLPAGSPA
ncbi:16S rRNA (cytosine(1402)-N(4))-methyltransferase RsmH [Lichenicoccus sp.]|uniref:16S rRNA (cytosine(1402)-N(4))-methyltransferase RsmH n=1 Tax=Lichenicoccus sp. TaxID=2781899 RepID=UPI003D13A795